MNPPRSCTDIAITFACPACNGNGGTGDRGKHQAGHGLHPYHPCSTCEGTGWIQKHPQQLTPAEHRRLLAKLPPPPGEP